ncbi:MAG: Rpn family recombination-promoting nuclease/putative transposase [Candidatus Delongbacteria bacterium]|nr:Rpn family recombination-promoting nuclease/putative transposase [Candidatus Delongbacteria bacterium]
MCRINPKIDIAFKKLFGSEENKDILKSFINSVLPAHEQVKNLELKNPYNLATYISGKSGILDVKAQAENGVWFDVEMQIGEQLFFGKRIKYYLDKMYVDQLDISENYSTLKKVIGIAILDFDYFPDDRYKRGITYKDIDTDERYENFNLSDIYFIELKKFGKDLKHLTDTLDRWITFLNKAHEYNRNNIPKELSVDIDVKKAIDKLEIMYLDDDEKLIYENERKIKLDKFEEIRTAEFKGIEKGREEGEKLKAIEIARNLLDVLDEEIISEKTGLSVEEIRKLSNIDGKK